MHFNSKILRTVALIPGTYYRRVHIIEEYGLCNGLIDSPPLVVSMVLCAIRRGFLFGLILEVDMTTTLLQYHSTMHWIVMAAAAGAKDFRSSTIANMIL